LGRKSSSGFPLFLIAAVILATAGCRAKASLPLEPGSFFSSTEEGKSRELGIYSGSVRVGDLRFTVRKGIWDGSVQTTEWTQNVLLRISFRDQTFSIRSDQTAWVGPDLDLLGSVGAMDFGAGRWETKAVAVGGGRYEMTQSTLGRPKRENVTVPEGALVSDVLPMFLHRQPEEEGFKGELTVFNMNLGQELPFTWTCGGQTAHGRLFTVTYWGMEEKIWMDSEGMVVREEMLLGVQARLPEGEERRGHLALETVLAGTAVPAVGIPEDMADREEVTLALEGAFRIPPNGKWQEVNRDGDRALVRLLRPTVGPPGKRKPDSGMMPSDDFALDLDSGRILDLSARITEGVTDPWEKAMAVARWVNLKLGKSMRESFSALQVLEAGEGECQSHSLLAVALCRAAGLPARFVYGIVYMPDQASFFFHTWVEVHVGEWIPMDPTLGDFPSGVDHLTLAVGSYRDQFRIFPFIMGGGWRISFAGSP